MTRNIVPRNNDEGSLGTTLKNWLSGFFNWLNIKNYIDFETTENPLHKEGRVFWDDVEKTLAIYNDAEDITHQLGQEFFVRASNESGVNILNGQVVRIVGSINFFPSITLSQSDSLNNLTGTIGLATHDILDGSWGYITMQGKVHDLDTSAFSSGDTIYVDAVTPGELTNIKPAIPFIVGYCIKSDPTEGIILVSTTDSVETTGDMLTGVYDANSNNIVDKAEELNDGSSGGGNQVTASEARTHIDDAFNPHSVTKSQVGLGNVPNLDTTDAVTNEHTHLNKTELDLITDGDHDVRTDNPHNTSLSNLSSKDHSDLDNKNSETDIKHVTDNQKDALDNANSPSSGNAIATINDLTIATKELFTLGTDYNTNFGDFRARSIGSGGSYRFNFRVPHDFTSIIALQLIGIPQDTFTNQNIQLESDYGQIGELYNNHSQSNLANLVSMTSNTLSVINLASVFSSITAGDVCGLFVNHSGIGTTINYIGIRLRYT